MKLKIVVSATAMDMAESLVSWLNCDHVSRCSEQIDIEIASKNEFSKESILFSLNKGLAL